MTGSYEFENSNGFYLDEERLRAIYEIITNRSSQKIKYTVYRADNYFYDTFALDDVLRENNPDWRKIIAISIEFEKDSNVTSQKQTLLSLTFSIPRRKYRSSFFSLYIQDEDRDFVYSLGSDLKKYLTNEVALKSHFFNAIIRMFNNTSNQNTDNEFSNPIIALLYLLYIITTLFILSTNIVSISLIPEEHMRLIMWGFLLLLLLFILLVIYLVKLFPTAIFYIGKEKLAFERKIKRREQIFWVIGAGFIVSIVGSWFVQTIFS